MPSFSRRRTAALATVAAAAALSIVPAVSSAATRTWVSGVGDDVNPCSRTTPCKTLAGAISKTDEGGEINAIDSGGFGTVTITKSVTIDLRPYLGGVLNSGVTGVVINAGADDEVTLRGLDIHASAGAGVDGCEWTGVAGVRVMSAKSVVIEDSRINEQAAGIVINPTAATPSVTVDRTTFSNICKAAIDAAPTAPATTNVLVRDSLITGVGTAVRAVDGAAIWVTGSALFKNGTAFETAGTGSISAFPSTLVQGNGAGETPTAVLPGLVAPTPTPAPTPASTA